MGAGHVAQAQSPPREPWNVELELQRYRITNNEVQIPNDSQGTRFDANAFTGDNGYGVRVTGFVPLNLWQPDDALRVVLAPLNQSGTAVASEAIAFDGAVFQAGLPLTVKYAFSSLRFTYVVPIFTEARQDGWDWRIGGTLAVRYGQIKLSQGALVRDYDDIGVIPLLYLSGSKTLGQGWKAEGEFDAFPAPGGGGLFDGSLKLAYRLPAGLDLTGGMRYQVGAAKDPQIYNSLAQWGLVVGLRASF